MNNIKYYAVKQGLSAYALAKKANLPYTTCFEFYVGKADIMSARYSIVLAIAKALKLKPSVIVAFNHSERLLDANATFQVHFTTSKDAEPRMVSVDTYSKALLVAKELLSISNDGQGKTRVVDEISGRVLKEFEINGKGTYKACKQRNI